MVIIKREDVTKQGFCLILWRKLRLPEVFISTYFCFFWVGGTRKRVGAYLSFSLRGREVGWRWALIRGWALIKFFCPQDGRLFEVDANSRLGAYSNKNGNGRCVIFQPMVFRFVWAKQKWKFIRDRCKLFFPPLPAASPFARASSHDSFARHKFRAC